MQLKVSSPLPCLDNPSPPHPPQKTVCQVSLIQQEDHVAIDEQAHQSVSTQVHSPSTSLFMLG